MNAMSSHSHSRPSPPSSAGALEALYATGHWLHARDRFTDAASVFHAMIRLAPDDERGWLALGACLEALEDEDAALEVYGAGTVEAVAPRCELARARVLQRRGRGAEARAAVAEAGRIAERQRDHELRCLVAAERGVSP